MSNLEMLEMKVDALARLLTAEDSNAHDSAKASLLGLMDDQQNEAANVQKEQTAVSRKAEYIIEDILVELGMPTNIRGFNYAAEAIRLAVEDEDILKDVTKRLYPDVANKFKTTASRTERAIRHSIERVWDRCDLETLDDYFGNSTDPGKGKTTNSQFISRIAKIVRRKLEGAA